MKGLREIGLHGAKRLVAGLSYVAAQVCGAVSAPFRGAEFLSRFFRYVSRIMTFEHREDDVFICSYPRSGTTWTQMILYQVMTDGDMSFSHISEVVPYFETTLINRGTMDDLPSPRLIKTHVKPWRLDMKVGKYIYVQRDVADVLVSFYHFHRSHKQFTGSFDEFVRRFQSGRVQYGSWFRHVASWMKVRDRENVLFLTYEELSADRRAAVLRIAEFCGVRLSAPQLDRILERTSFEFMKLHESKFDYISELVRDMGLSEGQYIRKGEAGAGKLALREDQAQELDRRAAKWIRPRSTPPRAAAHLTRPAATTSA